MAKINTFKDIVAWQKADQLALAIYKNFKNCRDFSFRDQIQRATVSIMNNIAEGFERKGDKEFKYHLFVAQGSCAEVRSMIVLAQQLRYISKDKASELESLCLEITKMLAVFIKRLSD